MRWPRRTSWPSLVMLTILVSLWTTIGIAAAPTTADASPASSTRCAAGTDSGSLRAFFGGSIDFGVAGVFQGADYQRTYALPDGRVLWMFDDAFIGSTLAHNVAMIQQGNCFRILVGDDAGKSWLLSDRTTADSQWFWAQGGAVTPDGQTIQLLMSQMNEPGPTYLSRTVPTAVWIVTVRLSDFRVLDERLAPNSSDGNLFGFSVTSDSVYTYLYSNCFKQFGWGLFGNDPCTEFEKVGRVPRGRLDLAPEYWDGKVWQADPAAAVAVVSKRTTGFVNNPAQVYFDGSHFLLAEKEGDWFGQHIIFQWSSKPVGPWTTYLEYSQNNPDGSVNTGFQTQWLAGQDSSFADNYFASWINVDPGANTAIFGLSHNTWAGAKPGSNIELYRPTFDSIGTPQVSLTFGSGTTRPVPYLDTALDHFSRTITRNYLGNPERFWIDVDQITHSYQNRAAHTWTNPSPLGGPPSGIRSAEVATEVNYLGNAELYVVASDGQVWHDFSTPGQGSGWSGWYRMGGPPMGIRGEVVVGRNYLDNQELYVLANDGRVWHSYATPAQGTGWSEWSPMGAPAPGATGDVHVSRNTANNQELFVLGADASVWHSFATPGSGTGWAAWSPIGGVGAPATDVAAWSNRSNRQELFAVAGGQLWHQVATPGRGSGWSAWTAIGSPAGVVLTRLAGVDPAKAIGVMRVWVRDANGTYYYITLDTSNIWTGWLASGLAPLAP